MVVTAASWDDLRLDDAEPCVAMVARDMVDRTTFVIGYWLIRPREGWLGWKAARG